MTRSGEYRAISHGFDAFQRVTLARVYCEIAREESLAEEDLSAPPSARTSRPLGRASTLPSPPPVHVP